MKKNIIVLLTFVFSLANADSLELALQLSLLLPKSNHKSSKNDAKSSKNNKKQKKPLLTVSTIDGIAEVPVLQQGFKDDWPTGQVVQGDLTWSDIKSVDGGNCGYHALKNIILLMNVFKRGYSDQLLAYDALTSKSYFFDFMSVWGPMIWQGYRNETDSGKPDVSWLQGQQLDYLKANLENLKQNLQLENLNFFKDDIYVVEDVTARGSTAGLGFNEDTLTFVRRLAVKKDGMAGVVWTAGKGGHWVGFVVVRNNYKNDIYYMNSARGINPNFQDVKELFNVSVQEIDAKIAQTNQMNMQHDLDRIKQTVDYLSGNKNRDEDIYEKYLGCVVRSGSMMDEFNLNEIRKLSLPADELETYLEKINAFWKSFLQKELDSSSSFAAIKQASMKGHKNRAFEFWTNPHSKDVFVRDLGVDNCDKSQQNVTASTLLIFDKKRNYSRYFNPADAIHTAFNMFVTKWEQYDKHYRNDVIRDDVKQQTAQHVDFLLDYLKKQPELFRSINWCLFGTDVHPKIFDNGFQGVMNMVLQKVTDADKALLKDKLRRFGDTGSLCSLM